jgi:C1A family cysteine protease
MAKQITLAATVLLVHSVAGLEVKHPIRQELVDSIKAKTKSWKPREIKENHFRDVPLDRLQRKFGLLGTDVFSKEMKAVKDAAVNMTSQAMTWMTSFMGVKATTADKQLNKFKLQAGNGEPVQMYGENGAGI